MKRVVAVVLWFYAGWTAGALIDFLAGTYGVTIGPALGPILGTAAAAIVAGDPRGLIWGPRPTRSRTTVASATVTSSTTQTPA